MVQFSGTLWSSTAQAAGMARSLLPYYNTMAMKIKSNVESLNPQHEFSYQDMKNYGWLGGSLDSQPYFREERQVTGVCAPRWKNQIYRSQHYMNGVCYWMDDSKSKVKVNKELPLVNHEKQTTTINGKTFYHYGHGQAGMSIHFTDDQTKFIVGAPGVFNWHGTVILYQDSNWNNPEGIARRRRQVWWGERQDFQHDTVPNPSYFSRIRDCDLFGYAVTSGRFLSEAQVLFAGGAPRGADSAGFVEVNDDDVQDLLESHAESLSNDELIELDKTLQETEKEGDEDEEPVRGLDIKTLRECLGGIKKALETMKECDPNPARGSKVAHHVEKSVKIYQEIYDEKNRKTKRSTRSSSQSDMLSLSHLPTLLQLALPQYPLSSNQNVGSISNLHLIMAIRFTLPGLARHLFLLGISIWMAIMAIEEWKQISWGNTTRRLKGSQEEEVAEWPRVSRFVTLTLDHDSPIPRAVFSDNRYIYTFNQTLVANSAQPTCRTDQVTVKEDKIDPDQPILMKMDYDLVKNSSLELIKQPMTNPGEIHSNITRVGILKGCVEEVCNVDLTFDADLDLRHGNKLVVGQKTKPVLRVQVFSSGEPAYLPTMVVKVDLPLTLLMPTSHDCKYFDGDVRTSLECRLSNPIKKGGSDTVEVSVDASQLTDSSTNPRIQVDVGSEGRELKPEDNQLSINLQLVAQADMMLHGIKRERAMEQSSAARRMTESKHAPSCENQRYIETPVGLRKLTEDIMDKNFSGFRDKRGSVRRLISVERELRYMKEVVEFNVQAGQIDNGNRELK
ncbi:Integrin alpha-PS3 [Portunus trituberculatus]|uniref:Integrin alpha-PS3 n=1 Tax=Portunus trituberculatus TaxID=210409 RepID=A0A5B7DAU7_PORTR|nr:Integrin alpha-PS3 [Portunus trituberculatus]